MTIYETGIVDADLVREFEDLTDDDIGRHYLLNRRDHALVGVFDTEEEAIEAETMAEMFGEDEEE